MLLPYASDHRPTRRPVVTLALLAVSVLLTAWTLASATWWQAGGLSGLALLRVFGIVPARFNPLTLVTYPLFHESLSHLLMNVFYLWVFGPSVEEAVGRGRFLLLYLAGGAVGGALQALVTVLLLPPAYGGLPIVGASASCAALVGIFAVRYYRARLSFVGLSFRPHVVSVVTLFLAVEIGLGLWDLSRAAPGAEVAHWAHIGGFLFGLIVAQLLRLDRAGQKAYLALDATRAMDANTPGAAIRNWETLLARDPENVVARVELARSWVLLGDAEQAIPHYLRAVQFRLARNERHAAADLFAEMRDLEAHGPSAMSQASLASLTVGQMFTLGTVLEEAERYALASDTFGAIVTRHSAAPEAETALLKVVALDAQRLNRPDNARRLLALFFERYPNSPFLARANDLRRAVGQGETPLA